MPLEEYTYDEQESGRVDTLVQAIERIERLEKQLEIAVEVLNEYAEEDNWEDCHAGFLDSSIDYGCYGYYGYQQAQEALLKIKELEK